MSRFVYVYAYVCVSVQCCPAFRALRAHVSPWVTQQRIPSVKAATATHSQQGSSVGQSDPTDATPQFMGFIRAETLLQCVAHRKATPPRARRGVSLPEIAVQRFL